MVGDLRLLGLPASLDGREISALGFSSTICDRYLPGTHLLSVDPKVYAISFHAWT